MIYPRVGIELRFDLGLRDRQAMLRVLSGCWRDNVLGVPSWRAEGLRSSEGSVYARHATSGRSTKRRQPAASDVACGLGSGNAMSGGKVKKVVCGLQ
jgi:hypothetical protein